MLDTGSPRLSRRGMLSVTFAAIDSACYRSQQHEINVHIALANATALIHLPLWLARELGYFREEGLAISLDDARGGSKAAEALLAGSANVASAPFDQAVALNQQGRECLVFWLLFDAPDTILFGSPVSRPPVRSLSDVIGRTVGVSTVGSPIQKEIEYAFTRPGFAAREGHFCYNPESVSANRRTKDRPLRRGDHG